MKKDDQPPVTGASAGEDDSSPEEFAEDLAVLVEALRESFEAGRARYFVDEIHEILYIEIEGLEEYSPEEVEEIASPLLEELDLDFEEISLLPLSV